MTNYRSLIPGGFFWNGTKFDKDGKKVPVSIRANNPGAVNGAAWERELPGYVTDIKYDGKNNTTIFETPEHGVATYWELLRRYRDLYHLSTVWGILGRYIGPAGQQDYFNSVRDKTGFGKDQVVDLYSDAVLMPFAKAQFRHEAGVPIPWSDAQIKYGLDLARAREQNEPAPQPQPAQPAAGIRKSALQSFLEWLFGKKAAPPVISRDIIRLGDKGDQVKALQDALVRAGFLQPSEVDGDFGAVTQNAVRQFQTSRNLDPDGEVGPMTRAELAKVAGPTTPSSPQPTPGVAGAPVWYALAQNDIGFHETGNNRGIEQFIRDAQTGSLGDPWCAIWVNAKLEDAGIRGSRSAAARSFEHDDNFIKLPGPALGAIVTMWRGSPSAGTGHVFLYDGESSKGIRGIGANESDMIKRSFHERGRIVGYYWPKAVPLPSVGRITVADDGSVINVKET